MVIILLLFLIIVGGLLARAWVLDSRNEPGARLFKKLAIAIGLLPIFLFISLLIVILCLWGGGGRHFDPYECGNPFTIINNSSIPLRVSADLKYTPEELENLKERGIYIDLSVNFIDYDVLIPKAEQSARNSYGFTIPTPTFQGNVEWPSNLTFVVSDSLGRKLITYHANDIDSTMRMQMQLEITDSLLQSVTKTSITSFNKKGGGL